MLAVHTSSLLIVTLAVVNLVNLTLLYRRYYDVTSPAYTWAGRDYPRAHDVDLDPVFTTFDRALHYPLIINSTANPTSFEQSDLAFLSMLPSSGGYLHLSSSSRTFDLSIYHELHCFRTLFHALSGSGSIYDKLGHNMHCIDYLRNMATCYPDLTLEPLSGDSEDWMDWNTEQATHTCRDWGKLYDLEKENWEVWKKHV